MHLLILVVEVSAGNVPVQVPAHSAMTESSRPGDGASDDVGTPDRSGSRSIVHTAGHGGDFHGLAAALLGLQVAADAGDAAGADA